MPLEVYIMAENKRKLILDVDTGSDDALAIMCALLSPEFEVLGICSVRVCCGARPICICIICLYGGTLVSVSTTKRIRLVSVKISRVDANRTLLFPILTGKQKYLRRFSSAIDNLVFLLFTTIQLSFLPTFFPKFRRYATES